MGRKKSAHLLGIGLDGDGHFMTETVMKTFEDLKRKGKELEETSPDELSDILRKNMPDRRR